MAVLHEDPIQEEVVNTGIYGHKLQHVSPINAAAFVFLHVTSEAFQTNEKHPPPLLIEGYQDK